MFDFFMVDDDERPLVTAWDNPPVRFLRGGLAIAFAVHRSHGHADASYRQSRDEYNARYAEAFPRTGSLTESDRRLHDKFATQYRETVLAREHKSYLLLAVATMFGYFAVFQGGLILVRWFDADASEPPQYDDDP